MMILLACLASFAIGLLVGWATEAEWLEDMHDDE